LAIADTITFYYEGEETNALSDGTITGTLVFDSSIADSFPVDPEIALYAGAATWTGQVTGGDLDGITFAFESGDIIIFNDLNGSLDQLSVNFFEVGLGSSVLFNDIDGTAFVNDDLPIEFDLNDFEPAVLVIDIADFGKEGPSLTGFNITSITAIPEPSFGFFAGSSIFVIALRRRRR
jgi:hypothetical protein